MLPGTAAVADGLMASTSFVLNTYESTITSKHKIEFEKDIVYGYGGVD